MKHFRGICTGLIGLMLLATHSAQSKGFPEYKATELTNKLSSPWAVYPLTDGKLLITEKPGNLRVWQDGALSAPLEGVPEVYYRAQGGLLDVKPHPDFANNQWIYLSYSSGTKQKNTLKLARARLQQNKLTQFEELFSVFPYRDTPVHYAGRILFLPDGTLLLTSGDGYNYREQAQKLGNHFGKVIRLNADGSVPKDNPFITDKSAKPEVWSYGHRNPQGLVFDSKHQQIISHEHGPKGGDEINILRPGKNYGWPVITYGVDYSGAQITPFTEYDGMEQPTVDWTPSIAPSGMVVYQGDQFPQLAGDLLVSSLKFKQVRWLSVDGNKITPLQTVFKEFEQRLRDITVDAKGHIYLITDAGSLIKISAK